MLRLALHIFPVIQIALLILAFYFAFTHVLLSLLLLFLAALFLNFTLHITIHHFVHFKTGIHLIDLLYGYFYSVLLVLPFDFYRIQHYNHHRYNNLKGDVTSTWEEKDGKIHPKSFFRYAFLWFLVKPSPHFMQEAVAYGDLNTDGQSKIRLQFILILLVVVTLFFIHPLFLFYYGLLFYLGWTFIAITNYGQHLPIKYGDAVGYTFKEKFYNFIFFNNGLHYEHHENPKLNYPELKFKQKAVIRLPHLLAGFFTKTKNREHEI